MRRLLATASVLACAFSVLARAPLRAGALPVQNRSVLTSQQSVLVPTFIPNSPIYFTPFAAGNNNHYYWIWYTDPHSHVYAIDVATHVVLDPAMKWDLPYLGPPPHHGNAVVQAFGLGPVNTQNLLDSMVPVTPAAFSALAAATEQISVDRWRLDPQLPNLVVYGSWFGALENGFVAYMLSGPGLGESVFNKPFTPGDWDGLDNSCARIGDHVLYNTLASPATTKVTILVDNKRFGTTRPLRDPRVPPIRPVYVWAPATAHTISVIENHGFTHGIALPCDVD